MTSSPILDPTLSEAEDDEATVVTRAPTTHVDGADTSMHETDNAFLPYIDDGFMRSEHDSVDVETDEERSTLQI